MDLLQSSRTGVGGVIILLKGMMQQQLTRVVHSVTGEKKNMKMHANKGNGTLFHFRQIYLTAKKATYLFKTEAASRARNFLSKPALSRQQS